MTVTVHRGTHQIGGCATEFRTASTRILIDMGAQLPDCTTPQEHDDLSIPGITCGRADCDAVFFTHTHGDHVGLIGRVLPSIPLYMGETAKELYLTYCRQIKSESVAVVEQARTFVPNQPIHIGDITVTPFLIDHSAFDAYMFLIEAEGVLVLHTGDFRFHGFRGSKTCRMLEAYVGQVDYLVCEGTMLSRRGEAVMTERELQERARALMMRCKHVFVLCSSTNIDRIAAFYGARPDRRPAICDNYQKEMLDIVRRRHGAKTKLYDFQYVYPYYRKNEKLQQLMKGRGFLAFIRANTWSQSLLEQYGDGGLVVYSMWPGYLKGSTKNEQLSKFLAPYDYEILHTSGHATAADIALLCKTVQPKKGIIPIHSQFPQVFSELLPEYQVVQASDGIPIIL